LLQKPADAPSITAANLPSSSAAGAWTVVNSFIWLHRLSQQSVDLSLTRPIEQSEECGSIADASGELIVRRFWLTNGWASTQRLVAQLQRHRYVN